MRRFFILVSVQLLIIFFLIGYICYSSNILGGAIINPIKKESISENIESTLQYFYEPKANSVEKVNEWGPYNAEYIINSDTLHERFEYSLEKKDNVYRIITLGDSYTYGLYVDTKDNWTERLEDILNNPQMCEANKTYEVINLGVHGYDIQSSVERFRLRGVKYNPDIILWLIKSDDVVQMNEIMFQKMSQYSKSEGYENWNRGMRETYEELGQEQIIALQNGFIEQFMDMHESEVILLTFPSSLKHFPKDVIIENLNKYKERLNYTYLTDIYKNIDLYYANDYHPTAAGHKVIAEDVYKYLTENNIIPCN